MKDNQTLIAEKEALQSEDGTGNFQFNKMMEALGKGVLNKVTDGAFGFVLNLLESGDSKQDDTLEKMEGQIKDILGKLDTVIDDLNKLINLIDFQTADLKEFIKNEKLETHIDNILFYYGRPNIVNGASTLKFYFDKKTNEIDSQLKNDMQSLVRGISDKDYIQKEIMGIFSIILPQDDNGILYYFTEKFILKKGIIHKDLLTFYKILECFFSKIILNQFKGAHLVIEAYNYQSNTETNKSNKNDAEIFMTSFKSVIEAEVDEFIKTVTWVVSRACGLFEQDRFFSKDVVQIMTRAKFFANMTTGKKNFGLELALLGPSNITGEDISFNIVAPNKGEDKLTTNKVEVTCPDRHYDCWGTLNKKDFNKLKFYNKYTLNSIVLPSAIEGKYSATYGAGDFDFVDMGKTYVKKYNDQFKEDSTGEYLFGFLLAPARIGGSSVVLDQHYMKRDINRNDYHGSLDFHKGTEVTDEYVHLWVRCVNNCWNEYSKINMKQEAKHEFSFEGRFEGDSPKEIDAYLNIETSVDGRVFSKLTDVPVDISDVKCEIGFRVGIYDETKKNVLKRLDKSIEPKNNDETRHWEKTYKTQLHFKLEQGHKYSVYSNVWAEAYNENADYDFHLATKTKHASISFVKSEFG